MQSSTFKNAVSKLMVIAAMAVMLAGLSVPPARALEEGPATPPLSLEAWTNITENMQPVNNFEVVTPSGLMGRIVVNTNTGKVESEWGGLMGPAHMGQKAKIYAGAYIIGAKNPFNGSTMVNAAPLISGSYNLPAGFQLSGNFAYAVSLQNGRKAFWYTDGIYGTFHVFDKVRLGAAYTLSDTPWTPCVSRWGAAVKVGKLYADAYPKTRSQPAMLRVGLGYDVNW